MKATLWFDGACHNNGYSNARAAGAAVIKYALPAEFKSVAGQTVLQSITPDGLHAKMVFGPVFSGSNNEAEYRGLIEGLIEAVNLGVKHIEIYGDSMLVVRQVRKEWKCKKPHLQVLRDQALVLLGQFESWKLDWVPREENAEADTASNIALAGTRLRSAPSE